MRAFLTCGNILTKSLNSTGQSIRKMADIPKHQGFSLQVVVEKLKEFAPAPLAEKWDNTGLLMEPFTPKPIKKILLTNDLTEDVMVEAVDLNADMIISYHPPIFASMKSVSQRTWKERVVSQCLENRIAVYSPHTTWDAVVGGVNDWLASALPEHSRSPVTPGLDPTMGCGRICILNSEIPLSEAVDRVKLRCGLDHVRLALARGASLDSPVSKVAICAGSGASLLRGIPAQLYITGEMLHHDVLDAVHNNASVILTNHSDSERGFLSEFQPILSKLLEDQVEILISQKDHDPLVTV